MCRSCSGDRRRRGRRVMRPDASIAAACSRPARVRPTRTGRQRRGNGQPQHQQARQPQGRRPRRRRREGQPDGFVLAAGRARRSTRPSRASSPRRSRRWATWATRTRSPSCPRWAPRPRPVVVAVCVGKAAGAKRGEPPSYGHEALRRAAGAAARALAGTAKVGLALPAETPEDVAAVAEGALLGAYALPQLPGDAAPTRNRPPVESFTLVTDARPGQGRQGGRRPRRHPRRGRAPGPRLGEHRRRSTCPRPSSPTRPSPPPRRPASPSRCSTRRP